MKFYLSPQIEKIGKFIIAVIAALPAVFCIYIMAASGDAALVIGGGFMLYGALLLFGKVCSLLYAGELANGLIDFLLYPKRYLKRAPVILSRQQGLITRGDYNTALAELLQLQQQHPESPEVAEVLSRLYGEKLNAQAQAMETLLLYFQHRKSNISAQNLPLALRLTEMLQKNWGTATARSFLEQEISKKGYTAADYQSLQRRHRELGNG